MLRVHLSTSSSSVQEDRNSSKSMSSVFSSRHLASIASLRTHPIHKPVQVTYANQSKDSFVVAWSEYKRHTAADNDGNNISGKCREWAKAHHVLAINNTVAQINVKAISFFGWRGGWERGNSLFFPRTPILIVPTMIIIIVSVTDSVYS